MRTIIFATTNIYKFNLVEFMFNQHNINIIGLHHLGLYKNCKVPLPPEENGKTFRENAFIKASYYAKELGHPCLSDDSGLEVDALNGAPGLFSSRYSHREGSDLSNNELLLQKMANVPVAKRRAVLYSAMVLVDKFGSLVFQTQAELVGKIIVPSSQVAEQVADVEMKPSKNYSFGYDSVFQPDYYFETLDRLDKKDYENLSHRARAAYRIGSFLVEERDEENYKKKFYAVMAKIKKCQYNTLKQPELTSFEEYYKQMQDYYKQMQDMFDSIDMLGCF